MQDGNEPQIITSRAAGALIISLNVHFAQSDIVFMLALFYLGFFLFQRICGGRSVQSTLSPSETPSTGAALCWSSLLKAD